MNKIEVTSLEKDFKKWEKQVKIIVKAALAFLKKKGVYLEIFLVSKEVMRTLNKLYRQKNKPTNILSFPVYSFFPSAYSNFQFLGEIYISPFYILEQGEDLKKIVIHGLLHLLGYTHQQKSDTMKMEALEEKLLHALN